MFKLLFSALLLTSFVSIKGLAQTFNLGKFSIGESRIKVELSDFIIHTKNPMVSAKWVPESVQWIRNENNLLVPRALLWISVTNAIPNIHIEHKNKAIIPFKKSEFVFDTEVYIDLFNPGLISIFSGEKFLDKIIIDAQEAKNARSKQLIDYSCSPYDLKIDGIDSEYLSIGCKMNQLSSGGKIYPLLEITMSTTNLRMLNKTLPPYTLYLHNNSPVEIKMSGVDDTIKTLQIKATLPKRLYRLKTAFGFGPYVYQSESDNEKQSTNLAPSIMLYAKYDLTETASLKAFDALLYSKSRFNNSGFYFSYDLATAFDERVMLNALLGFQGLHYKFDPVHKTEFHLIYPQGFEFIYKHAFIENYNLMFGMFLATGGQSYTNAWLRYGKRGFLELNFIDWGDKANAAKPHIKMWGLSVGIPFFNAF
jgi:hypothetical protein